MVATIGDPARARAARKVQFAVGARPSARSSALRADEALYAKKADKGQFMAADWLG